ncbi:MAG: 3-methyl-2-oxobutanoate dehydrogenase subunit VorB [Brevinematia bacterium]
MKDVRLMKGNEALVEGALIAGCRFYFGYPITPQNEVTELMSVRMPEAGGVFIQAESELAAINMVFGASAAGGRVMTTTSSPGFSLMQEGVSYLATAMLPCVLANVQRGGPGLGNIAGSQGDYFQATKGGGHGDYHTIVLAPASPQEMLDFTILGFELSDKYRTPALILSDGIIGQMMENVKIPSNYKPVLYEKSWALTGAAGRKKNVIRSLWLDETLMEKVNLKLQETYKAICENEVRYEEVFLDDAKVILVAYGISSRVCNSVTSEMRKEGYKVGLLRPITLYPFPYKKLKKLVENGAKAILTVEMSSGQMVEDVKLGVECKIPVEFYGKLGGVLLDENEIKNYALNLYKKYVGEKE